MKLDVTRLTNQLKSARQHEDSDDSVESFDSHKGSHVIEAEESAKSDETNKSRQSLIHEATVSGDNDFNDNPIFEIPQVTDNSENNTLVESIVFASEQNPRYSGSI